MILSSLGSMPSIIKRRRSMSAIDGAVIPMTIILLILSDD